MTFTADMARKMAEDALSLDGPYGREETEKMLDRIRGCAQKGQHNTTLCGVPYVFHDIVKRRLEAEGFKVTDHPGSGTEDNYTDISWYRH